MSTRCGGRCPKSSIDSWCDSCGGGGCWDELDEVDEDEEHEGGERGDEELDGLLGLLAVFIDAGENLGLWRELIILRDSCLALLLIMGFSVPFNPSSAACWDVPAAGDEVKLEA